MKNLSNSMMNRAVVLKDSVAFLVADQKRVGRLIRNLRIEKQKELQELDLSSEAKKILQHVGELAQQYAVSQIESLVTYALKDVFGRDSYVFRVDLKHGKKSTSVTFYFEKGKDRFDPLEACEYGAVDVACFALRIAMWKLNPSERTMIFDEPFKNVSAKYIPRVGQFVQKISHSLEFQFVIITHIKGLLAYADNVTRIGE